MDGTLWFARILAVVGSCSAAGIPSAVGDQAEAGAGLPAAVAELGEPRLLAPTFGRPVFVEPAGKLTINAQIPGTTSQPVFELVSGRLPAHRHLLSAGEDAAARLARGRFVTLTVPADVPAQTYDLEIRCGQVRLVQQHCVAVGPRPERVRLVHLSNMNIGEVGTPDFDWRLVDEVNLVAPTLIVATGDLVDSTHHDPDAAWEQAADFFCWFDAPALIACGDHDDLERYCRHAAPSPVGAIEVGAYRGVVLFDLPARTLGEDPDQVRWLEETLTTPGDERITFVIAHDESPNLLREWQRRGVLPEMVQATRLGVWFSGGHRDWDGIEYRPLVDAAAPLLYVRTHQASTSTRDGADGVAHYRVVDLVGERAVAAGIISESEALPPSIAVGKLSVHFDGRNDGTQERVAFTAVNNLPFRLDGLSVRVWLKRREAGWPWCMGATLEEVVELGQTWECRLRFGLPDKGALRAVVASGPEPRTPDVRVYIDAPSQLVLARHASAEGLSYVTAAGAPALIRVQNRGASIAEVTPVVRLDGATLPYVVLDEPGPTATAYRLKMAPGRTLTLQVDLSAIRVAAGRRELQVYLRGPADWRPACFPLEVSITP